MEREQRKKHKLGTIKGVRKNASDGLPNRQQRSRGDPEEERAKASLYNKSKRSWRGWISSPSSSSSRPFQRLGCSRDNCARRSATSTTASASRRALKNDFVGVANGNADGYTAMRNSEQVSNSEVGSFRPQDRHFLDQQLLDQHLLTQWLDDEEDERLVAAFSKDIILAFGDFSEQSSWKGRAPRKGKGKRMQKAKRCPVCLTKEWMTPKICSCCTRKEMKRWRRVWAWCTARR